MNLKPEIHPLNDFQQRLPEFVEQLRTTGEPIVLTVGGQATLVVQDATSYRKLLAVAEEARTLEGIRQGLEEMRAGFGRPADEVLEEIRREFSIPHDV